MRIPKIVYLGNEGEVALASGGNWDFLYNVSTEKPAGFDVGDTVVLPDKREFRLGKSSGAAAMYASHGCDFTNTGYVAITAFATSNAIGESEITIPAATHAALTEDELAGGYVVLFDGASDYYTTTRMIVGNNASAANAAFKVRLDAAISYAITSGTSKCEVYKNPWEALTVGATVTLPKAGVAAAYVSAAANYFWVQTKGICWVAPQTGVGADNGGIGCYWRHDGSLESTDTALAVTTATNDTSQYAGYVIAGSAAGNGPLFVLQG